MSDQPNVSTSEPIYKAAATVGTVIATVLGVLGGAVTLGVVSSDQAAAITQVGQQVTASLPQLAAAVTVVVGVVSGVGASVLTAWSARKQVRPLDSDALPAAVVAGEHRLKP